MQRRASGIATRLAVGSVVLLRVLLAVLGGGLTGVGLDIGGSVHRLLAGSASVWLGRGLTGVCFGRLGRLNRGVVCRVGVVQLLRLLIAGRRTGWIGGNGVHVVGATRMMLLGRGQRADGLVFCRVGDDGDKTWSELTDDRTERACHVWLTFALSGSHIGDSRNNVRKAV